MPTLTPTPTATATPIPPAPDPEYGPGEVIESLPTGVWFPEITSGGFFRLDGETVTIKLVDDGDGYVEHGGFRYTCISSAACGIVDRQVTQGTIRMTTAVAGTPTPPPTPVPTLSSTPEVEPPLRAFSVDIYECGGSPAGPATSEGYTIHVTISGVIRSTRGVTVHSMEVEGTANGVFVGFDVQTGDFYARESRDFHIEGTIFLESDKLACGAELKWS